MALWVMDIYQIFSTTLSTFYVLAIVSIIILMVLENRNPVKTVSWILVLTFLPVVGLILYLLFGRDQRRERRISKKGYSRLLSKPRAEFQAQEAVIVPTEYKHLVKLFQNVDQSFPFGGNQIETYIEGQSMLNALLEELRKAEHHIHMEFYIFNDDEVGHKVLQVLEERARAGVKVRVIYDAVGCWNVSSKFSAQMEKVGIEVRAFLKVYFPIRSEEHTSEL